MFADQQVDVAPPPPNRPYPASMSVSAHDVAREIRRRRPGVGDVKLQKLLYYCQGYHLAFLDRPLFRERVSAFDMGPVVGELWYAEAHHFPAPEPVELDNAALNTIGYVLSRYGDLSGPELVRLTHSEPPWQEADAERTASGARSTRIADETMRDHFRVAQAEDHPPFDEAEIDAWLRSLPPRRAGVVIDDRDELARRVRELFAQHRGSAES